MARKSSRSLLPAVVVLLLYAVVSGLLIYWYDGTAIAIIPAGWKQVEVIGILLAAAALVLTGVAALVAVLAWFAYGDIKKTAVQSAVDVARGEARDAARKVVLPVAARVVLDFRRLRGEEGEDLEIDDAELDELVKALSENDG